MHIKEQKATLKKEDFIISEETKTTKMLQPTRVMLMVKKQARTLRSLILMIKRREAKMAIRNGVGVDDAAAGEGGGGMKRAGKLMKL